MASTIAHHVDVSREDIERAVKAIARQRLQEQTPGLQLDELDWHQRSVAFLPEGLVSIHVILEPVKRI